MKKITIIIISVALLAGFVMADPGINQTPETQGINTDTTVDVVGNFASTTDVAWRITNDADGLSGVPDLDTQAFLIFPWLGFGARGRAVAHYTSVYTEDTQSNGEGIINYDKSLNVETSECLSGESNIEATKQINYVGLDGANRVTSTDYIMVDGVNNWSLAEDQMLCLFAGAQGGPWTVITPGGSFTTGGWSIFPPSCNFAEAGSTIDMTMANVRTTSSDRFITPSADTPIALEHDILVSELGSGIPSVGTASTHMQAVIMEARGYNEEIDFEEWAITVSATPMEQIRFSESTSITGEIATFAKEMGYNSQYTGAGEMNVIGIVI